MKLRLFFFSILFFISAITFAQGGVGLSSLNLNPSTRSTGLGWTGVSNPTDDPLGFYYNPAMLGYSSQQNNISVEFNPGANDWINLADYKYSNYGFNLGYNFKNLLNGLDLSVGAGFIHSNFDFGANSRAYDSYNAYALGVSIDYYILLSLGITFKDIHSQTLSGFPFSRTYNLNTTALDYGIHLLVPVIKLIDNEFSFELSERSKLKPIFNYNLGYSRLNIGDEVYYVDPGQKDPLPLTARLGHTFRFGIDYEGKNIFIKLISYDLILEAQDVLVERETFTPDFRYQGMFGDIEFWKHLVQLKGDENVVVHKGHSISLAETVTILLGSFHGRGYQFKPKTNGLLFSTKGLFKWLNSELETDFINYLSKHFDLRFISSTIFDGEGALETDLYSLSVHFMNFSFN
jgi:hypothetical protein